MTEINVTNKILERIGFRFTMGAIFALAVIGAISLVIGFLKPIDDCDRGRFDRCGMHVAIDAKTGKEYLLSPYGGIIERK